MKALLRLGAALAAPALCAEPALHVSTGTLAPETTITITFDRPVAAPEMVGKTVANRVLRIEPRLEGRIFWRSAEVARFVRTGVPEIATTYRFSIRKGLEHLDGTKVPATEPGAISTERFVYEYSQRSGHRRNVAYFVRFNDAVRPDTAQSGFVFRDEDGRKVRAAVRQATWGDSRARGGVGPTWAERFTGWAPPDFETLDPAQPIATAVLVTPAEPLPIGEDWELRIEPGLPNATGTARTTGTRDLWIGDVRPFEVSSIRAVTEVDAPRHISVSLSKRLPDEAKPETLAEFLTVQPAPPGMKLTAQEDVITVAGDFANRAKWTVTLKRGLTAADGMAMPKSVRKEVHFKRLAPRLVLPGFDEAQLALGTRDYRIDTVNLASARIRIKKLEGQDAIRAFQGYRHYTGNGPGRERLKKRHAIPYELVVGRTIHDEVVKFDNPLDTSRSIKRSWDDLLGAENRFALLFVSVEGEPKPGTEPEFRKRKVTQAFVQLTDIGLAWKLTGEEAFLFAYSCHTGQPLPGVRFDLFGEDAEPMESARGDRLGVARLVRGPKHRHLRASVGGDAVIVPYDDAIPTVSMWRFPVRTSHMPELPGRRTAMLFTDRDLYRPGETVHLKGLVRRIERNALHLDASEGARLTVSDPSGRVLLEKEATLSKQGSFDLDFGLPEDLVGRFHFELSWPEELAAAAEVDDWRLQAARRNSASFSHRVNVQEFRRNAFEVTSDLAVNDAGDSARLAVAAKYYQGQPVAGGAVDWFFRASQTGFYPAGFRDYLFCDHRTYDSYYWSHYFGYGESDYYGSNQAARNGSATLDSEGRATLDLALPDFDFPSPRRVTVTSEVTDLRNQTLSSQATTTVHGSDFYLGVSRHDSLVRAGEEAPLRVVAVGSDGAPARETVAATLTVAREVNQQVKTRTGSGTVAVRNETRLETLEARPLVIAPGDSAHGGLLVPFRPAHTGKHILTFHGTDSSGRPFRTAVVHYVYGTKEHPWAYESGMRIKLVPEKQSYRPGETARILVLSPIEGTALVTFERDGVQRHLLRKLRADDPVIEAPVTHQDAPNTFLSVLVIKGTLDGRREHREPMLRLGYCELNVENVRERLAVGLKVPRDYHRPGEEVVVSGAVRDHTGQPVPGAEVTLYAEDEGTLAVAGYDNPNPLAHFYAPRSLQTKAGTSLDNFVSENPEDQYRFNKGFFVGGGPGAPVMAEGPVPRAGFNPCAVWLPALVTDAAGRFEARFDSPDTLTRYRVLAVAHEGAHRFGSGHSEFVVKKPLMLEPAVPRFAHEGDRLQPKVLVQNATSFRGVWEVTLKLDSITNFVNDIERAQTKTVTLGADDSAPVAFDLVFAGTGAADWEWSARPVAIEGAALTPALRRELSDAVVSRFDVEYPMPLLRETRFVRFEDPAARRNLLDGLSGGLLDGRGELELEFGRSIMMEAAGAVDFLLHYPYGCAEQTTSSTLPWIAARSLRDHLPELRRRTIPETRAAIQAGANRLLSMQTDSGGLAYWPGGREATDWASAYGGMALLLCRDAGAEVPEAAIDGLRRYLAEHLRGLGSAADWWALETACRTCYTLALAGDPQVAYHNKLIERADTLSLNALSFLSLAVHRAGGASAPETAAKLLDLRGTVPQHDGHFLHHHPSEAYRLLALTTIRPGSEECDAAIDRLLQQRGRHGHWGTTWGNAWTLYALGEHAANAEALRTAPVITLTTDEGTRELRLDAERPSHAIRIPLHGGLEAHAAAPKGVFARIKLAAKPRLAPSKAVATNGLRILRTYQRVLPNGSIEPLQDPEVGDLVRVDLQVTLPRDGTRYLVIDDPLPSLFEAVNTDFASQAGRVAGRRDSWRISHRELRDERALFFLNRVPRSGSYTVSYHARVATAGEAAAPPAKVEAMYEPEFFALSTSRRFQTPNPLLTRTNRAIRATP